MTEEECLQEQLDLANHMLEKANKIKNKFVPASYYHKLRSELNALWDDAGKVNESNFSAWGDGVVDADNIEQWICNDDYYWMDYSDMMLEIDHVMECADYEDERMERVFDAISPEFLKMYHHSPDKFHGLVFKYNKDNQITVLSTKECIDILNKVKTNIEEELSSLKTVNYKK